MEEQGVQLSVAGTEIPVAGASNRAAQATTPPAPAPSPQVPPGAAPAPAPAPAPAAGKQAREAAKSEEASAQRAARNASADALSASAAADATVNVAEEVARLCGRRSLPASNASAFREQASLQYTIAAAAALQALKASEQAKTAIEEGQFSVVAAAAATAKQAAANSNQAARAAQAQLQGAKKLQSEAAESASIGASQHYSERESKLISYLHRAGLMLGATPRDLKRLLNRYLLSKYIMHAALNDIQVSHVWGAAEFVWPTGLF